MNIFVYDDQSDLLIDQALVKKLVHFLLVDLGVLCDEVTICFTDKKSISQLHEQFFNDPTPTDCISFPIDNDPNSALYKVLGEIFVCPEVAMEYSNQNNIDPYEELSLYIVHGILHLIGYDDIEEKDREEMRKKEFSCMNRLKEKNGLL